MTIKEIRKLSGLSQSKFCEKYHIKLITLRKWEQGTRTPPAYVNELLEFKVRENLNMNKTHKLISERLDSKKDELKTRQNQFEVMWNTEKDSGCFERNAINDLLVMQQLKSEISELEYWKTLTSISG